MTDSRAISNDTVSRLTTALIDRYRIERELGTGGMATVYLAHDLKCECEVAIKVLNAELAESLGRQRFVREIRLAARLNHPHILAPLRRMPEFERIVAKAARRVAEFSA